MTYPNSSPIRRSARGTRGFRPGRANDNSANDDYGDFDATFDAPHWPDEPWDPNMPGKPRPDTSPRKLPFPDNDPRDRRKLIRYHLRRGGNLLRGLAAFGPLSAGWEIGSTVYEIYRQRNLGNVAAQPYPEVGGYSHSFSCPQNDRGGTKFWKGAATWNDNNRCLTLQAQFAGPSSMWITPKFSSGSSGLVWSGADGELHPNWRNAPAIHYILWEQYCIGVGCATSRSREIAHVGTAQVSNVRFYTGSPWWLPSISPAANPAVNPHALPINVPVTAPKPMPYRSIPYMPVFDPYAPGTTPLRGPLPVRAVALVTSPWSNGVVITPGKPVVPAPPHVRRPPVRGEKERKPGRDVKRAIDKIVGPVTEAVDAIDAVYKALPWSVRQEAYQDCLWAPGGLGDARKCMTPQRKLRVIYDNADRLDMAKVVENLAKNHVEDMVIGNLSRRADKNLRDRGWHDRFGRGPTSGPAL